MAEIRKIHENIPVDKTINDKAISAGTVDVDLEDHLPPAPAAIRQLNSEKSDNRCGKKSDTSESAEDFFALRYT